jgi:hypothetical protein
MYQIKNMQIIKTRNRSSSWKQGLKKNFEDHETKINCSFMYKFFSFLD